MAHSPSSDASAGSAWTWGYRFLALALLTLANILNYTDRSLLGALAQPLKHDLAISNAQLGFLSGTSFVLFNALIGLTMVRLGDNGRRNLLLMFGIGLWSLMTAMSGFASSYPQLVVARIGVGEAAVTAIGYSMLADIFPLGRRALVFSLFGCAPFIGLALSLGGGSWVAQTWPKYCATLGACGVKGWQAAFLAFGAPGIVVALLVGLLREPRERGVQGAGRGRHPVAEGLREMSFIVPPFTLWRAWRIGGRSGAAWNLGLAAVCAALAWALVRLTGDVAQWVAVATAAYGVISWARAQAALSPELYRLTLGSRALLPALLGASMLASVYGAMAFWSVSLAVCEFGLNLAQAGTMLGAALGGGSMAGIIVGGAVADRWRRCTAAAPIYIAMISAVAGGAMLAVVLAAPTPSAMVACLALLMVCLGIWPAGVAAFMQELVTPSMRTRAAAIYVAITTLIAGSLGPYAVGRLADATGSIRIGLAWLFVLLPCALALFWVALRSLPEAWRLSDETALRERRDGAGSASQATKPSLTGTNP